MLKYILLAVIALTPLIGAANEDRHTNYKVVKHPRKECWKERVQHDASDYTGAVLGGVAGGILGNQVGKGNGRSVATVVGATTGVIVGDHIGGKTAFRDKTVTRCRTVVDHIRVPLDKKHENHRTHKSNYKQDHNDN